MQDLWWSIFGIGGGKDWLPEARSPQTKLLYIPAIDGEQYVAVTTGWDLDARGLQNGVDEVQKTKFNVPQGGTIWVFKLQ
jgi:hypothetical protein